jgi:beta-lactamase regulating signal transducer with metallopeptidase domain
VDGQYTRAMIEFQKVCSEYEIQSEFFFLFNESLITRARNYCADEFMRSDFTHLMFVDSLTLVSILMMFSLLQHLADPETDKDIICGAYP